MPIPVDQISIAGDSGQEYIFNVYALDQSFKSLAGIYIYAACSGKKYKILYVGETEDISNISLSAATLDCLKGKGADRLCVHPEGIPHNRIFKETDILDAQEPDCN